MDPRIPAAHWQRLFEPPWPSGEDHVGYALREGERYVGFAAYIFSDHPTLSGTRRLCNVSTWTVDADHRNAAMSLLMPVLKRKDLVVTNLTALPQVHEIFVRLGFRTLETRIRVHPFWPGLVRSGTVVHFDDAIDPLTLPEREARTFQAHRTITRTAAVHGPQGTCFVVYTINRRRGLRTARLHHVGSREGLSWSLRALQYALLRRHGAVLLEYDHRLAVGAPGPFRDVALHTARLFRGDGVTPDEISNAYSETVLLNL